MSPTGSHLHDASHLSEYLSELEEEGDGGILPIKSEEPAPSQYQTPFRGLEVKDLGNKVQGEVLRAEGVVSALSQEH